MALNTITILSDMPKFAGSPREGEPRFKQDLDPRTFLRSVENYFENNNVTSDDRKIQIFFSLIDKSKGNAIDLLTCYAGKAVPFERIKKDFLLMYPSFQLTDFRHAARTMLALKITNGNIFCNMIKLENATRAVAEAYVRNTALTKGDFDEYSEVTTPPLAAVSLLTSPTVTTASPTPVTQRHKLVDVVQNIFMQLFLAAHTDDVVYDKLANHGPRNASTELMSDTVRTVEQFKLAARQNKRHTQEHTNEVVWAAHNYYGGGRQNDSRRGATINSDNSRPAGSYPRRQAAADGATGNAGQPAAHPGQADGARATRPPNACFNCGSPGHFKKNCPNCAFCKKQGHTAKNCKTRITQAKGKFCRNCQLKDSHNTNECRKLANQGQTRSGVHNVRLATQGDDSESDENTKESDECAFRDVEPGDY